MARVNIVTDNEGVIAVKLTDGTETMAQILARIKAINTAGTHVHFDTSAIAVTNPLYLCTIYMNYGTNTDPTIVRLTDQVTGKQYVGNYVATETLAEVLAKAVDAYVAIVVTATTQDGETVTGQTVSLYEGSDTTTGTLRETAAYNGQPVSFMVAKGFEYFICITNTLPDHFNPSTAHGNANTLTAVTLTYEDTSNIQTFAGISDFLSTEGMTVETAKVLVGKGFDDVWVDYDTTETGDAKTKSDAGATYHHNSEGSKYTSNVDSDGHPIWYDPWIVTDVKQVVDEDDVTHIGAILMRQYCGRYDIVFDAANTEEATEATAQNGIYYYGLSGSTYSKLSLPTGDTIPYSDYDKVFKNAYSDSSCNIVRYGHNRYETSAIRQYLNTDDTNGSTSGDNWWTKQHVGQAINTSGMARRNGSVCKVSSYKRGCSADILGAIQPVKHTIYANTVCDGGADYTVCDDFFLPSCKEMYGVGNNVSEGDNQQKYWTGLTGYAELSPADDDSTVRGDYALNEVRKMLRVNGKTSAAAVWLRSAYRGYSHYVWNVGASGNLYGSGNGAYGAHAPAPACVIY